MASNIYFQNSITDQNLLDNINREVIQQAGIDVMYLPRTLVKEDLDSHFGASVVKEVEQVNNYFKNSLHTMIESKSNE